MVETHYFANQDHILTTHEEQTQGHLTHLAIAYMALYSMLQDNACCMCGNDDGEAVGIGVEQLLLWLPRTELIICSQDAN